MGQRSVRLVARGPAALDVGLLLLAQLSLDEVLQLRLEQGRPSDTSDGDSTSDDGDNSAGDTLMLRPCARAC